MKVSERVAWEAGVAVGARVRVHWGYGEGVRGHGSGEVVKVNMKSVRVRVTEVEETYHVVGGARVPECCGSPGTVAGAVVTVAKVTSSAWNEATNSIEPCEGGEE